MQQIADLAETIFTVGIFVGATLVVALNEDIVKRGHQFLDLQKRLGTRRTFLFVQDGLGAALDPGVE